MLGWLIEIRNFFIAISLAWIGISFVSADESKPETPAPGPASVASVISSPGLAFLLHG